MIPEFLPTKRIAYAFTVALHFAQHFELNMRAIIHTLDYHGWIEELPPRKKRKRYKDASVFIDKAFVRELIEALNKSEAVKSNMESSKEKQWKTILETACERRNRLAHTYLAEQDFDSLTGAWEDDIVRELDIMALEISHALKLAANIRERLEFLSDQRNGRVNELLELAADCDSYERKYIPKHQRETSARKK